MKLSIIVPARHEEFLSETVDDLVKNRHDETEIIVGLDGEWPMKPIRQYPHVNYIYYPESIGQRAMSNRCVDIARGKYVMKVDAHCSFDEGFDIKMLDAFKEVGDDVCIAPAMRNLHVYDWKCYQCGKRTYQDKGDICPVCGTRQRKKLVWKPRHGTWNYSYLFTPEPKFGYYKAYKDRQVGDIVETMSLQGSCFMCTKYLYNKLNICDEELGSWGSQGIEISCKFWLSGRRVLVNKKTWYAHCFRTKAVFGFPYSLSGRQVHNAKAKVRDLFYNYKWPQQTRSLRWLIEKFNPPDWKPEDISKLK